MTLHQAFILAAAARFGLAAFGVTFAVVLLPMLGMMFLALAFY